MDNYSLGGSEVKSSSGEAIGEIGQNKTLFIQKLTQNPPVKPEVVKGITSIDGVFQHFKPEVEVNYEDSEGVERKEKLHFQNVGDFSKQGIIDQSDFLKSLNTEKDQYLKIVKQLKSNKILKMALEDPDAKEALLESIYSLLSELKEK